MLNATMAVDAYLFTFQSLLNQGFDRDDIHMYVMASLMEDVYKFQSLLNQGFDRD